MTRPTCNAIGCAVGIFPTERFCPRHCVLLSDAVRAAIASTHRPGKPPSKALLALLDLAQFQVRYVETEGHLPPQQAALEWDNDDPRRI